MIITVGVVVVVVVVVVVSVCGKRLHPRSHKIKIHWKMPLTVHWIIRVKIHWTSDNPLEDTLISEMMLEDAIESHLENATENPRRFLRCRFLVCNSLPLYTVGAIHTGVCETTFLSASLGHGILRQKLPALQPLIWCFSS